MINLTNICTYIETELKIKSLNKRKYYIYADAEYHKKAVRTGNTVETSIEGIATTLNSSIVPVKGLNFGTQVIGFELAIPIDHEAMFEEGIETIVNTYKQDIDAFVSNPQTTTLNNYVVTVTGTLAEVGEPQTQSNIGLMIPITFTLTFNYFANGVNSTNQKLYYIYYINGIEKQEEIPFTSLSIGRNVVQDGGAFSNTNGIAKNYVQTTALAMEFTMPALKDNDFCELFRKWLLHGNDSLKIYGIDTSKFIIAYNNGWGEDSTDSWVYYTMMFLTSNLQAQGLDNVGYTITLAEAR